MKNIFLEQENLSNIFIEDLISVPDMNIAFIKGVECLVDTEGNEHEFMPEIVTRQPQGHISKIQKNNFWLNLFPIP